MGVWWARVELGRDISRVHRAASCVHAPRHQVVITATTIYLCASATPMSVFGSLGDGQCWIQPIGCLHRIAVTVRSLINLQMRAFTHCVASDLVKRIAVFLGTSESRCMREPRVIIIGKWECGK